MKKLIFSFVVLFVAVSSFAQMPQVVSVVSSQKPDSEFFEIYNQAVELNKDAYPDFHKIPINAPVAFPDYDADGIIYFPARVPENGKNDCIWFLTLEYQKIKAKLDSASDSLQNNPPTLINVGGEELPKFVDYDFWARLAIISLILLVIAAYLLNRFRPWNNRRNINRNPVISGGLSNNPAEAAAQIAALIPGSRVVKSERGRLICATKTKVDMNFSDGIKKVKLISGEEYYRITESNGTIRYARKPCGNLINGSISELPVGVTFVLSTEENSTWIAPKADEKQPEAEIKPEIEEESPIEVFVHLVDEPTLSGSEISMVLGAAGEMKNVPSSITYGALVIRFYKDKDKDKEKGE